MYGHGAAPPARSAGTVITLRVLFAAVGFLSCGLLACAPLFRVAFLRGRLADWAMAWVSLPLSIAGFAVVGALPEADVSTDIALALVLLLGLFSSVYFLVIDIRFHQQRAQFTGYAPPPQGPTHHSTYGYPQPASPYTATPVPQPRPPAPHAQGTVVPPPPPQRPAPARIDQVRAELDELSDYLRKHDDHHNGNHEGGR
ncbi:hypothetical protein [Streptomyces fulvoviolaceus]|uniref:hypothetical protein n=1 Tax=Streptomyces fulvoviolaceus TaxID=285535 RepID=UPI0021BF7E5C|nr:hypothetical protein [Streptomyces fulvoviolaceus]MCT9080035.1 hypothetical protein [Streptomyces fulvoviolaceus]